MENATFTFIHMMTLATTVYYGRNYENIIGILSNAYDFNLVLHNQDNFLKFHNERLSYEEFAEPLDFVRIPESEIKDFANFLNNIETPDGSKLLDYLAHRKILFKFLFWYLSDELAKMICSVDALGRHVVDTFDKEITILFDFPVCDLVGEYIFKSRKEIEYLYHTSHDIDFLQRNYFSMKGIFRFLKDMFYLIERKDIGGKLNSFLNFEFFERLNSERNFNSAYFFMTGLGKHPLDGNTDLFDSLCLEKVAYIISNGHLFGLHPSILSNSDEVLFQDEIDRYLTVCNNLNYGGPRIMRMHYLQEITDDYLELIDTLGFEYESSKGFSNYIGYRLGSRFPVRCFIKSSNTLTKNLRYYPLIVMDTVLLSKMSYEELSARYALTEPLLNRGDTLWHNSNLKLTDELKLAEIILK